MIREFINSSIANNFNLSSNFESIFLQGALIYVTSLLSIKQMSYFDSSSTSLTLWNL